MKSLKKVILMLFFIVIFDLTSFAQESSPNNLDQSEVLALLGNPDLILPTNEEFKYMKDNLDYILDSDSESEMQAKIDKFGFDQWMEIKYPSLEKPHTRAGVPGMFSADFVNKVITSSKFNTRLEFTNLTPFMAIQAAGNVIYYYKNSVLLTKELVMNTPYIDIRSIMPQSTKIAYNYSYPHYNLPARYEGNFVVVDESGVAKVMPTVKEHKY